MRKREEIVGGRAGDPLASGQINIRPIPRQIAASSMKHGKWFPSNWKPKSRTVNTCPNT
jgi:hypothetical protein